MKQWHWLALAGLALIAAWLIWRDRAAAAVGGLGSRSAGGGDATIPFANAVCIGGAALAGAGAAGPLCSAIAPIAGPVLELGIDVGSELAGGVAFLGEIPGDVVSVVGAVPNAVKTVVGLAPPPGDVIDTVSTIGSTAVDVGQSFVGGAWAGAKAAPSTVLKVLTSWW